MKPRFRAYSRDDRDGMFYWKDSLTGERGSLETKDPDEAERLVSHKNEALKNPQMNHRIGMAYLSAADPEYASRDWKFVMDYIQARNANSIRHWLSGFDPCMKPIDFKESAKRWRFASPHDTFVNHDQALRIARRRWKRNRSKYLRRIAKRRIATVEDEYDQAT